VPKIGVACACDASDDSVVTTCTVRAGGRCVDGHDMTWRSWLGVGTIMDGMGDSEEVWRSAMARAEKVDQVMDGREMTRQYINDGTFSPRWSHDRGLKDTFSPCWNHHSRL
jgi:hypothetical protein